MPVKRTGMPLTAKMRHDAHYVEQITSRTGAAIGRMIPVEEIEPNAGRPRQEAGDLQALTDSVRKRGVLSPLLVRFMPESGKYMIISGQRRYHAARAAGLGEVPCIEKDADDGETIELALIENSHHKGLTASEEANAVSELAAILGVTHEEITRRVGIARASQGMNPHSNAEQHQNPFMAGGNMDSANDAVQQTETALTPEPPAPQETVQDPPTGDDAVAEASATPEAAAPEPPAVGEAVPEAGATAEPVAPEPSGGKADPGSEPSALDSELVCATERLLEEAKTSILKAVRGIASGLEEELEGYLEESRQKMRELRETGTRELKLLINEELALQRDVCIQELVVQTNNVVRDAVNRVRTETEEIVRAGCAKISSQLDSTSVALHECEVQFQANTKADAAEGVDAFRKQVNLLAEEILGQSRQAVGSVLEDLRTRMQKAASTLQI